MKIDRTTLRDRCRMAMAGIDKYLASEATIPLDGTATPPADVKKGLQNTINAADATEAARAVWLASSAAEQGLRDTTVSTLTSLRSFVMLKFGSNAIATLADFGFQPRKRTAPTVETKAVAAEKSLATRTARHTLGPKQKAKIKGTVAVTAPATPPAAPEPTAASPAAPVVVAPAAPVTSPKP
jgi:hypothetical protein